MKKEISTSNAPSAIGPYSQAIKVDDMIFVSGQIPVDPKTGNFAGDDIESQATQSLTNLKNILETEGYDMSRVVKTTVFLTDLNDFAAMNAIYEKFFIKPFPARSCVQVAKLPKGAKVEIEVIAK